MPSLLPGTIARDLRDGLVTERQKLSYLVLYLLSQTVSRFLNSSGQHDSWRLLLYGIMSLIGLVWSFGTNARGDNRHFIERWFCLNFSLAVLVVFVPQCLMYGTYWLLWHYGVAVAPFVRRLPNLFVWINILLLCLQVSLLNHFMRIAASSSDSTTQDASFAPISAP